MGVQQQTVHTDSLGISSEHDVKAARGNPLGNQDLWVIAVGLITYIFTKPGLASCMPTHFNRSTSVTVVQIRVVFKLSISIPLNDSGTLYKQLQLFHPFGKWFIQVLLCKIHTLTVQYFRTEEK